jgi:hypothetical protein
VRLSVPANDSERVATIDGALRCTVALSYGTRVSSCKVKVPAKSGAELLIEHGIGPLRAMVHAVLSRYHIEPDPTSPGDVLKLPVFHPRNAGLRFRAI